MVTRVEIYSIGKTKNLRRIKNNCLRILKMTIEVKIYISCCDDVKILGILIIVEKEKDENHTDIII